MSLTADLLFGNFPPPPPPPTIPKNKQQKAAMHPNSLRANHRKREEAIARYKAAMGDSWWTPAQLGEMLGVHRNVPNKVMVRWFANGIVDRRKLNTGYEWRMK